jgi:hypothetical protein
MNAGPAELSTSSQVASEGVVAFIDALGTKGISARTDPEEYARSWESLLTEWEQYKKEAAKTSGSSNLNYDIRAFSDTIIVTVKLNKRDKGTPIIESDRLATTLCKTSCSNDPQWDFQRSVFQRRNINWKILSNTKFDNWTSCG